MDIWRCSEADDHIMVPAAQGGAILDVIVRNELTSYFGTRYIGRREPLTSPAKSPDPAHLSGIRQTCKRQSQTLEEMETFIEE